jgi:hypothetical protein
VYPVASELILGPSISAVRRGRYPECGRPARAREIARDDFKQMTDDSFWVKGKIESRSDCAGSEAVCDGKASSLRKVRSQCFSRKMGMSEKAL